MKVFQNHCFTPPPPRKNLSGRVLTLFLLMGTFSSGFSQKSLDCCLESGKEQL
ncbi:hypothetical protein [Thermoflexibacter ruber]|uniref:Uncharacterized protein n=1 Tax=Thermoflexibacter ruber TaxID=1003 RepID=A0A1I2D473_9BACT|nr:hypothetical protein [Thermoflexibacter ruber]SFE74863.1 hypothetical protein SAMN04488541_100640 [Thermoflexibacter ruber]